MSFPLDHNPRIFLRQAEDRFPECWKHVDHLRAQIYSQLPTYCFLPYQICSQVLENIRGKQKYSVHEEACLTGLAAWRATQGVYKFNDDLYNELVEMAIGPWPAEVLRRLPEWCVYIELQEEFLKGAFAQLDRDMNASVDTLRLVLVMDFDFERLLPMSIPLPGSLADGLMSHLEWLDEACAKNGRILEYKKRAIVDVISRVVSLVLYICSTNADINGQPVLPKPTKTKRGLRWFPPDKPTIWEVGYRDGPALVRSLRLVSQQGEATGRTQRPHVRRAHWHHYWIGRKGREELILKWLPPILVNVDESEQLGVTIRPVISNPEF